MQLTSQSLQSLQTAYRERNVTKPVLVEILYQHIVNHVALVQFSEFNYQTALHSNPSCNDSFVNFVLGVARLCIDCGDAVFRILELLALPVILLCIVSL